MTRDMLLALGIAMSSATQMRFAGLPLGLGDLCIVAWIGISLFGLLTGRFNPQLPALYRIGSFWLVFAFALGVGAVIGFIYAYEVAVDFVLHDTFAYLLVALMTCLAVATGDAAIRFRRMAWFLVLFASIELLVQIAAGWDLLSLPSVDPWYWDRFRGWSENPNQMAINCCILTLLAVHLALTSSGYGRILGLLGAATPLIAGRLSKSDTFITVMILSAVILFLLHLRQWLTAPAQGSSLRHALVLLAVVSVVPMSIALLPYAKAGADDAESFALSLAKDKGGAASEATLDLRLYLWREAIKLGLQVGSLGLGPGPHLSPPEGARSHLLEKPFEVHNTPLDIFLQSGIIGLAALFGLIASTAWLLYRTGLDTLLALIIGITIFSNAHFIMRQPIVWFALALCVSTGCAHASLRQARHGRR